MTTCVRSQLAFLILTVLLLFLCKLTVSELCQDCYSQKEHVMEEMTDIRIENIKREILKKLRLKEPPKFEINEDMPFPAPETLQMFQHQSETDSRSEPYYDDDYYGKLEQIIVFPSKGGSWCDSSANNSTICLIFKLPSKIEGYIVKSAEFWMYKEKLDYNEENFIAEEGDQGDIIFVNDIAILDFDETHSGLTQPIKARDGWFNSDITTVVRRWQKLQNNSETEHTIYVTCPTCSIGSSPPLSMKANQTPFILIKMGLSNRVRRHKRSIDCSPGIDECCRESLNISFSALGWSSWIISPSYYNAYFCRGTCQPATSVTNGNYYHSIVKQYSNSNPQKIMKSCCTPEKFSGLHVMYLVDQKQALSQILPKMIVESCGCV